MNLEMLSLCLLFLSFPKSNSDPIPTPSSVTEDDIVGETRRIIRGQEIYDTRPYMVYLRPTTSHNNAVDKNWLCGGVIIHKRYVLTSAACIEDIKYFYVVSGTHKWLPESETNQCILNGALRAVSKCVSRTYRFDGGVFNNIRWMINDIAVVMLEAAISFDRRVKGCDFIPKKIAFNNITKDLEKPGTKGFIAGWGSPDKYTDAADIMARTSVNSPLLMEAETIVITKESCKHRWLERYSDIIDEFMICGKASRAVQMSEACDELHVQCRQLMFSEEVGPRVRRFEGNPDKLLLDSAAHVRKRVKAAKKTRRLNMPGTVKAYGGFCENDHGGPLIVGRGKSSIVVGIMSAYRVQNNSKNCFGPFLYTSVYNNRHLIHCAIYKTEGNECSNVLRDQATVLEEETFDWGNTPIRPRTLYEGDEETEDVTSIPADNMSAVSTLEQTNSSPDGSEITSSNQRNK